MNTTLSAAKQQSDVVMAKTNATQAEAVEAMRAEIGPQHYRVAQQQLPVIEQAIQQIYAPFMAQATTIKFGLSVPSQVRAWCADMEQMFTVPESLRRGIRSYEEMQVPIWPMDGKSVDSNQRAAVIAGTRTLLMSHDGCLTHLDSRKRQIEGYIREWTERERGL